MLVSTNKIEFRQKRDFGEVLNVSFAFIKQNFNGIFKNLLFIAGPFVLVGSVLPGLLFYPWIGTNTQTGFSNVDFTQIIVNIVSFIIGAVMAVGIVYEYMLLYEKKQDFRITTGDIWKALRKDFFNILFTSIGIVIVYGILLGLIGYVIFQAVNPVAAFFIISLAGTYLTVVFSLLLIIRLCEKVNFFEAVLRCFKLIAGRWWQTFALLFTCGVIQFAIISVVFIPFSIIGASEDLFAGSATSLTSSLVFVALAGIVFILAVTLSFCLTLIVTGFQYFSLVEQKESVGLLQKIEDLGSPELPVTDLYEDKEEEF